MKQIFLFLTMSVTFVAGFFFENRDLYLNEQLNMKIFIFPEIKNEKIGVDAFLKDPSRYNFLCTQTSQGEVLSASHSINGEMIIHYSSFWEDGDHSGVATGLYDQKTNIFNGMYRTNDGRFYGEINFSFKKNGEANGTWDHGYGTIKIRLKNQIHRKNQF